CHHKELRSYLDHPFRLAGSGWLRAVLLFHRGNHVVKLLGGFLPIVTGPLCSRLHRCRKQAQRCPVIRCQCFLSLDSATNRHKRVLKSRQRILDYQVLFATWQRDSVPVCGRERFFGRFVLLATSVLGDSPDVRGLILWCTRVAPRFQVTIWDEMLFHFFTS